MMLMATGKTEEDSEVNEFDVSSHVIAANDDLLSQILVRLPVKSLLRFKSVSRNWLSLISSPQFRRLASRQRCSREISGIFLRHISSRYRPNPEYDFISVHENRKQANSPLERLDFVDDERGLDAVQFCNGLLLCKSSCFRPASSGVSKPCKSIRTTSSRPAPECKYYVFNPTTKEYTIVSANRFESGSGMTHLSSVNLAFDPKKSPHYKVIYIYTHWFHSEDKLGIYTYSSETGIISHVYNSSHTRFSFLNGLYWNGAINWIGWKSDGLYFNVDEQHFGILPMPPVPLGLEGTRYWEENGRFIRYFGESNDHLHLIMENTYTFRAQFNVYEMEKQYSGWFVRFRVDLGPVLRSFPESFNHKLGPRHLDCFTCGVLVMVRKDGEESFLVLSIPGKAIRYHFKDKSVYKMCDLDPLPSYTWEDSAEFIDSLYPL